VLKSGQMIDARLILGYYKHLLRLPQQFFDTMRTGEIIAPVLSDSRSMPNQLSKKRSAERFAAW
ncbi:MAG: ABC transporter transmembrane domain-containing protein, partial [Bacteroidota bacterium]